MRNSREYVLIPLSLSTPIPITRNRDFSERIFFNSSFRFLQNSQSMNKNDTLLPGNPNGKGF